MDELIETIEQFKQAAAERDASRMKKRLDDAAERNRKYREEHGHLVEVRHPQIGFVRVKSVSNFSAQCAAEELLGLPFLSLRGCTVHRIENK